MVERYMSWLNNLLVIKSIYGVALKGNKTKFLPCLIIWFYCKINCLMGRYFVMYHLAFQGAKVFNWIKTKIFCRNVKMHFLFAWKWESGNFNISIHENVNLRAFWKASNSKKEVCFLFLLLRNRNLIWYCDFWVQRKNCIAKNEKCIV